VSDGANKQFKKNPAAFLRDNVILLKEGGMPPVAGAYLVNLRTAPFDQVTAEDGRALGVFIPYLAQKITQYKAASKESLKGGDASIGRMKIDGKSKSLFSNQFRAFYLPWGPNATHVVDLDDRAEDLFTPGLTGCSFASTGGARPRAGHFNYQRPKTDVVSVSRTRKAVRTEFGGERGVSTKRSDYIQAEGGLQRYLFIVGWRDGMRWRFFRQHLEYAGAGKGMIYKRLAAPSEINNLHKFGSP
jgi:hypothetical protein